MFTDWIIGYIFSTEKFIILVSYRANECHPPFCGMIWYLMIRVLFPGTQQKVSASDNKEDREKKKEE